VIWVGPIGVIIFVDLCIAIPVLKSRSARESVPSWQVEMGFAELQNLESHISQSDWITVLGADTEIRLQKR
jgi:hypothetical protein